MKIIEISDLNKNLLINFLKQHIPNTFRYYNKRNINVIKNNILTILLIYDNKEIGYAHIDYDIKYWLGICILNEYQNKGFGTLLMNYIFNNNKIINKKIFLTVDKENKGGLYLYKKFNFKIVEEYDTYYLMNNS